MLASLIYISDESINARSFPFYHCLKHFGEFFFLRPLLEFLFFCCCDILLDELENVKPWCFLMCSRALFLSKRLFVVSNKFVHNFIFIGYGCIIVQQKFLNMILLPPCFHGPEKEENDEFLLKTFIWSSLDDVLYWYLQKHFVEHEGHFVECSNEL